MPEGPEKPFYGILDPIERISEVLFGVIMALTFTCTLGVATADGIQVKTMLIAALGCNLAWGIIDAGVYLIARVHVQGRDIMTLRAVRTAADAKAARRIIADALPPALAAVVSEEQLDQMRHRLRSTVDEPTHPHLTKRDWLAGDRKSTRLNSSHRSLSRMPSSA